VVGHPSSFLRSLVQIVFRSLHILRSRWRHRNLMANRLPLPLLIFGALAMPAAAQTVARTPSASTGFATPDGAVQLPATGTASSTAALVSGSATGGTSSGLSSGIGASSAVRVSPSAAAAFSGRSSGASGGTSSGTAPAWILCPPSGVTGMEPFLTGTPLSCAP
jgi:hypothetical protein